MHDGAILPAYVPPSAMPGPTLGIFQLVSSFCLLKKKGGGGSSIGRAEDFESSDPVFESRSPRRP